MSKQTKHPAINDECMKQVIDSIVDSCQKHAKKPANKPQPSNERPFDFHTFDL